MTKQPRFWVYVLTTMALLVVFWLYDQEYSRFARVMNFDSVRLWLMYRYLTARLPAILTLGVLGSLLTRPIHFDH